MTHITPTEKYTVWNILDSLVSDQWGGDAGCKSLKTGFPLMLCLCNLSVGLGNSFLWLSLTHFEKLCGIVHCYLDPIDVDDAYDH